MIDEKYLRELGFTDFIHLDKSKRDSNKRLTAIKFIDEQPLTILLIKIDDHWEIDRLLFKGDQSTFRKYFPSEPTINEMIHKLFEI